MRFLRGLGVFLAVALVGIQFVPVNRTNPTVTSEVEAPADVQKILVRSCYDCHSNQTRWPWYAYVAPISWRVVDHVKNGRKDLNFSEWPGFDLEELEHLLGEIHEEVTEGEMPLRDYLWLHPSARLSEADTQRLLEWAETGS